MLNDIEWKCWIHLYCQVLKVILILLRPDDTCDFWCNSCRTLQCKLMQLLSQVKKKVAISLWFRVPCLLQFPKNWHQVASSFEHVPNMRDIVARNCTEIAASLHAQCNDTTWAWQNLHWKVRQKLHQNRTCKRAFRLLTVYSLLYDWRLWGNNSLWSGQLYTHTLFCNTCKKCSSIFFYKPVS